MSGLSERDVERLAGALHANLCVNDECEHSDMQAFGGLAHDLAPVVAAIRDEAMASAIRQFGNRMATPAHPELDGPTLHAVWLESQYAADALFDGGDQS